MRLSGSSGRRSSFDDNNWLCGKRPRANTWVRPYGAKKKTATNRRTAITQQRSVVGACTALPPRRGFLSRRFKKGSDGVLSAGDTMVAPTTDKEDIANITSRSLGQPLRLSGCSGRRSSLYENGRLCGKRPWANTRFAPAVHGIMRCKRETFPPSQLCITHYAL